MRTSSSLSRGSRPTAVIVKGVSNTSGEAISSRYSVIRSRPRASLPHDSSSRLMHTDQMSTISPTSQRPTSRTICQRSGMPTLATLRRIMRSYPENSVASMENEIRRIRRGRTPSSTISKPKRYPDFSTGHGIQILETLEGSSSTIGRRSTRPSSRTSRDFYLEVSHRHLQLPLRYHDSISVKRPSG